MGDFRMPSLGASMKDGLLVEWKVAPGDHLDRGEIICEVETEKGDIDVEVWESGTVAHLLVEPGARVPVGGVMAVLTPDEAQDAGGETAEPRENTLPAAAGAPADTERADEVTPTSVIGVPTSPRPGPARPPATRLHVTPCARRFAADHGVDLDLVAGTGGSGEILLADVVRVAEETGGHHPAVTPVARKVAKEAGLDADAVPGTGPHGRVMRADVERAARRGDPGQETPSAPEGSDDDSRRAALRRAIGDAMARSKREIPHYTVSDVVDLTAAEAWLRTVNSTRAPQNRLLLAPLLVRAVARAARDVPAMNGHFVDGAHRPSEHVHVGVVLALRGGGIIAPAIHEADLLDVNALMAALTDLTDRARHGRLRASELNSATVTLTSMGDLGAREVTPIIYPPQVAIVGVGRPADCAWAADGMTGSRRTVHVTVAGDHRVSDGLTASKFLSRFAAWMRDPEAT